MKYMVQLWIEFNLFVIYCALGTDEKYLIISIKHVKYLIIIFIMVEMLLTLGSSHLQYSILRDPKVRRESFIGKMAKKSTQIVILVPI